MCILKSQSNSIQNINHIIGDFYSFRTPVTRHPHALEEKKIKQNNIYLLQLLKLDSNSFKNLNSYAHTIGIIMR